MQCISVRRGRLLWLSAVGALAIAVAGLAAWTWYRHRDALLVWVVEQGLHRAAGFDGDIHAVHWTPGTTHAQLRGLHVRAQAEGKVLRDVVIPAATVRWRWEALRHGVILVDLIATAPTVVLRARPAYLGPPTPPPFEEPGRIRVHVDTWFVGGTLVWTDTRDDRDLTLPLWPVVGSFVNLGTDVGGGRLHAVATPPGGGLVQGSGVLDFWNADHNAYDVSLAFTDLWVPALEEADEAYVGMSLDDGHIDGRFGLTFDPGTRPDLSAAGPHAAGEVDDLREGGIDCHLWVRDLAARESPIRTATLQTLELAAWGTVASPDPFHVTARGSGLFLEATPSSIVELAEARESVAPVSRMLRRLPAFDLPLVEFDDVTLQVRLGQRTRQVGELWLALGDLDNVDADDRPAWARLEGTVLGAPIEVSGTAEPLRWSDPLHVEGSVGPVDLANATIHRDLGLSGGGGDLSAVVDLSRTGSTWTGSAHVDGTRLSLHRGQINGGIDRVDLDLLRGEGTARGVAFGVGAPAVAASSDLIDLTWDRDALLSGELALDLQSSALTLVGTDGSQWRVDGITLDADAEHRGEHLDAHGVFTLPEGGTVRLSRPRPNELRVDGDDLALSGLKQATDHFLGVTFAEGLVDAQVDLGESRRQVTIQGHDLALDGHGDITVGSVDATVGLHDDHVDLAGRVDRVDARLELGRSRATGTPTSWLGTLRSLPDVRVSRLDVHDSRVTLAADEAELAVAQVEVAARDVRLGGEGPVRGHLSSTGRVAGGRASLRANLDATGPLRLEGFAVDMDPVALNPLLRSATGLDAEGGAVSAALRATVTDRIDGELALALEEVSMLQADDLRDGPGAWLKSAAAGAVVGLLGRDGRTTLRMPVTGPVARPHIDVVAGVGRALARSLRPSASPDDPWPAWEAWKADGPSEGTPLTSEHGCRTAE